MKKRIYTICLIDDEASVRKSMTRLLKSANYQVVSYASAAQFIVAYNTSYHQNEDLGCILLDRSMPEMNGLQLQHYLTERANIVPIIFLTAHADIGPGIDAMKKGALDFLIKPIDESSLFNAIDKALNYCHQRYLERTEKKQLKQKLTQLTQREEEIMIYIIGGALNKEIANYLGISEKTVKIHRSKIMHKMRMSTPAQLGHKCASIGLKPIKLSAV
jgi:FixJ family two-component response regulator